MKPGFLVIDKPPGITSHDAVDIVRAVTGIRKVGHTGTLDPMASGVLPLALGQGTRLIQYLDEQIKVYVATIQLGHSTTTGDREGELLESAPVPADMEERLPELLQSMLGPQLQKPPPYSAVKYKGKPLYAYAREGIKIDVPARKIHLYALDLGEVGPDWFTLTIRCSRGTYARVIAEDLGIKLGTRAHLSALRRTRSGPFLEEHSIAMSALSLEVAGMDDWKRAFQRGVSREERVPWLPREHVQARLELVMFSLADALSHLPALTVSGRDLRTVRSGQIPVPPPPAVPKGGRYCILSPEGRLLAVAENSGGIGKSLRVVG